MMQEQMSLSVYLDNITTALWATASLSTNGHFNRELQLATSCIEALLDLKLLLHCAQNSCFVLHAMAVPKRLSAHLTLHGINSVQTALQNESNCRCSSFRCYSADRHTTDISWTELIMHTPQEVQLLPNTIELARSLVSLWAIDWFLRKE